MGEEAGPTPCRYRRDFVRGVIARNVVGLTYDGGCGRVLREEWESQLIRGRGRVGTRKGNPHDGES